MCRIEGWNIFTNILQTMKFQKSKKRTCTKTKPTMARVIINPTVRRKIDFDAEEDKDIIDNLAENVSDVTLCDEQEENFEDGWDAVEDPKTNKKDSKKNQGKGSKQKKGKMKDLKETKANLVDETKVESDSKMKLHLKKPYDKQKTGKTLKKTNTSQIQKTDLETNENNNTIKENSNTVTDSFGDKLSGKTEDFLDVNKEETNQEELDNKINSGCDRDKNNNSDESLEGSEIYKKNVAVNVKCDSKTKLNNKRNKTKLNADNFDLVINDAQKFFESFFVGYKASVNSPITETKAENPETSETKPDSQITAENTSTSQLYQDSPPDVSHSTNLNKENSVESYDDFCSQSDEETENCVTKICDKVPTLVESLSNEEGREVLPDEFENNDVTCELLSTVFGMKKLMENFIRRRVRVAKPDAFVVEHIDFLVTIIKRDKNKINPVYYYGHNYGFLNAELAFSTLQNNTGLFLVKT